MIPVNKLFSDYLMSGSLFDECYFCLKFIRINSFIYLGRTGSLSPCTHSAVAGATLCLQGSGFSLQWLLLLWIMGQEHGQLHFLHVGSVITAPGLWSPGSVAGVHRCRCSLACGIFLNQRSKLCLLRWQGDPLPLSHQGSPMNGIFWIMVK